MRQMRNGDGEPWASIGAIALAMILGTCAIKCIGCSSSGGGGGGGNPPPPAYAVDLRPRHQVLITWADWDATMAPRPSGVEFSNLVRQAVETANLCDQGDHSPKRRVEWLYGSFHLERGIGQPNTACVIDNPWRLFDSQYAITVRAGQEFASLPVADRWRAIQACITAELGKTIAAKAHPKRRDAKQCPCWP